MNSTLSLRTRRVAALLAAGVAGATFIAAPAHADPTTINIVGTSDVYDSFLIQDVVGPGFHAAYPQYQLNYVSKGTGAAIAYAEAGTADGMIVHAATLENQFVADGYSQEKYGRSVFWGDYVFAGPTTDPAAVGTTSSSDIVGAFDDVAKAGTLGNADFVSRGGTPGTTVQEHQIWALVHAQDPSVTTCTVSAANGGGESPSTQSGACPSPIPYPSWYHATGATQAPNIQAANTCNFTNANNSGTNDCYVFTDRGTLKYLQSSNSVPNLKIVTRNSSSTPDSSRSLLVNAFHAYAVNHDKIAQEFPGTSLNTAGAIAFLDYLTSPAGQTAVGNYLSSDNDPPFIPGATPDLNISKSFSSRTAGGQALTVSGSIANRIPGYPALSGVKVALVSTVPGQSVGVPVTTATTGSNGAFTLRYVPRRSARYAVTVPGFSKVEFTYPSPNPPFGDLLKGTSKDMGSNTVVGVVRQNKFARSGHRLTLGVHVDPAPILRNAQIQVLRGHPGGRLTQFATRSMPVNRSNDSWVFSFPSGSWRYQFRYVEPGAIANGLSTVHSVRVP